MSSTRPQRSKPYYQLVFIWLNDPKKFSLYLQKMAPIVTRYGGALERMIQPDFIYADGVTKPDIVNIVYYDSKEAFQDFADDPEFKKIVHLRSESTKLMTVEGEPAAGKVVNERTRDRIYLVEVAKFGRHGKQGYSEYEAQAEAVMKRYGYHIERVFHPESSSGFSYQPDLVKVAYFDKRDGMERMHEDPGHQRIESLYPAVAPNSAWIIGREHPNAPKH